MFLIDWQKQGGFPEVITIDNGPEFAGRALDEWAYRKGVKLNFVRPGKPIENACAESVNGRFRDEYLNTNWFFSLSHARPVIEEWRRDYYEVIQHSSLKGAGQKEYPETIVEALAPGAAVFEEKIIPGKTQQVNTFSMVRSMNLHANAAQEQSNVPFGENCLSLSYISCLLSLESVMSNETEQVRFTPPSFFFPWV